MFSAGALVAAVTGWAAGAHVAGVGRPQGETRPRDTRGVAAVCNGKTGPTGNTWNMRLH